MNSLADALLEVLKAIFYSLLWSMLLFNLGRCALLITTIGRYPHGQRLTTHRNLICGVGVLVLFGAWLGIVVYNRVS